MKTEAEPIDVEILPPSDSRDTPDLSRLIAWLLDDLIRIPGTNFRIGLDPIIGLIPGFGDGGSAVMSSVILVHGLRAGVPRIVMIRMALNVLLNAAVGAIPVAGDIFSAWFKSNRKNYNLLLRHSGGGRKSTKADWIIVCSVIGFILLIAIGTSILIGIIFFRIFQLLFGF